jgi:ferritin
MDSLLTKEIVSLINEQIWLENNASFYYLYLSTQFKENGYNGISKFFLEQSNEERDHMLKLMDYLLDQDEQPLIPNYNFMEDLDEKFNILSHFKNSLYNERKVTQSINTIINKCKELNDIQTESFMQWFVTEQMEEESKFKDIIDDLKIIGDNGGGLFELNKHLGTLPSEE